MAKWKLEGECNHCGVCCQERSYEYQPGTYRKPCKYYSSWIIGTSIKGSFGHCKIAAAPDRSIFPKEDVEWWRTECLPFPNPLDEAHTPPRYSLPKECGYRMVKVE